MDGMCVVNININNHRWCMCDGHIVVTFNVTGFTLVLYVSVVVILSLSSSMPPWVYVYLCGHHTHCHCLGHPGHQRHDMHWCWLVRVRATVIIMAAHENDDAHARLMVALMAPTAREYYLCTHRGIRSGGYGRSLGQQ